MHTHTCVYIYTHLHTCIHTHTCMYDCARNRASEQRALPGMPLCFPLQHNPASSLRSHLWVRVGGTGRKASAIKMAAQFGVIPACGFFSPGEPCRGVFRPAFFFPLESPVGGIYAYPVRFGFWYSELSCENLGPEPAARTPRTRL